MSTNIFELKLKMSYDKSHALHGFTLGDLVFALCDVINVFHVIYS